MKLLKVINGTPATHGGASLCSTCRSSTVAKGENLSDVVTYCHQLEREIPFVVRECNSYRNASDVSLHEMQEIAWRLIADKSGKIGFLSNSKFAEAAASGKAEGDNF